MELQSIFLWIWELRILEVLRAQNVPVNSSLGDFVNKSAHLQLMTHLLLCFSLLGTERMIHQGYYLPYFVQFMAEHYWLFFRFLAGSTSTSTASSHVPKSKFVTRTSSWIIISSAIVGESNIMYKMDIHSWRIKARLTTRAMLQTIEQTLAFAFGRVYYKRVKLLRAGGLEQRGYS